MADETEALRLTDEELTRVAHRRAWLATTRVAMVFASWVTCSFGRVGAGRLDRRLVAARPDFCAVGQRRGS